MDEKRYPPRPRPRVPSRHDEDTLVSDLTEEMKEIRRELDSLSDSHIIPPPVTTSSSPPGIRWIERFLGRTMIRLGTLVFTVTVTVLVTFLVTAAYKDCQFSRIIPVAK